MRPLHVLIFLLPLVVLYEIGSAIYLTNDAAGTRETIKAYRIFGDFFNIFGVAGLFVPGLALVTVLLVWHIISRDKWVIRWNMVAGMAAESVAWTLPLIVLSAATSRVWANSTGTGSLGAGGAAASVLGLVAGGVPGGGGIGGGGGSGGGGLADLTWQAKLSISIGAGLYEEMLFRLVGIAFLHMIFRDILGAKETASRVVAVVGSAVLFALYHDVTSGSGIGAGSGVPGDAGGTWNYVAFGFLTLAGCYLGTVYVLRGFGIVVGAHALYDIVVLVLLGPAATATRG